MAPQPLTIQLAFASSSRSLQEMFAAVLGFPDYYGMNWDAFWDCASDPGQSALPKHVALRGMSVLEKNLPEDARILREILSDLAAERADVKITVHEEFQSELTWGVLNRAAGRDCVRSLTSG